MDKILSKNRRFCVSYDEITLYIYITGVNILSYPYYTTSTNILGILYLPHIFASYRYFSGSNPIKLYDFFTIVTSQGHYTYLKQKIFLH